MLNPIVFKSGVASELAVSGQPFAQYFIAGDIIVGAIVVAMVMLALRMQGSKHDISNLLVALIGFAIFGLFTALAAIIKLDCAPSAMYCGANADSNYFQLHDIIGLIAALGMTITFTNCAALVSGAWAKILIISLFLVWAGTGLLALLDFSQPYLGSFITQKIYLIINAALIFGFPYLMTRIPNRS